MGTRKMRPVADSRGVCYAPWMRRSTLRSTLRGTEGLSLVEVLAVTVIVGIAVIGVALMFGKGSAWVSATGADRVAAGLAQQRIEQIRASGWGAATADPPAETMSLATASTDAWSRPVRKSLAPSCAKARATAPPMAPEAP